MRSRYSLLILGLAMAAALAVPGVALANDVTPGVLNGTVYDYASETPIPGVVVSVYGLVDDGAGGLMVADTPTDSTLTDASGGYEMIGLPDAYYVVAFDDPTGAHRDTQLHWQVRGMHLKDSWAFQLDHQPDGTPGLPPDIDSWMIDRYTLKAQRTFRVSAADRFQTAIKISQTDFYSADTVVLVNGETFADALAAAPLAGCYNAPLLLTQKNTLPAGLVTEMRRLASNAGVASVKVFIVGGPASVGYDAVNQLKAAGITNIQRISGADRYACAAQVALVVDSLTNNHEPFVARGDVFSDALSLAPFAYRDCRPVLLTPTSGAPASVGYAWNQITGAMDTPIGIFVGGPKSMTPEVIFSLDAYSGRPVDGPWLYGADRYSTCAEVVGFHQMLYNMTGGWDWIAVASGEKFPDALAGGAAAGYNTAPLLLTPASTLDPNARAILQSSGPYVVDLQVYGGPKSVSDGVKNLADANLGTSWYDLQLGIVPIGTVTSGSVRDEPAAGPRRAPKPAIGLAGAPAAQRGDALDVEGTAWRSVNR